MWWFNRRRALVGCLLPFVALGGCGFRPLYATSGGEATTADALQAIRVPEAGTVLGFAVRQELLRQLNPGNLSVPFRYALDINLSERDVDLAVQPDATVTRKDLIVTARYALRELDGGTVFRGNVRRRSSYNVRFAPYATLVAEQDAQERVAREIAIFIRQDLVGFFDRQVA